MNVTQFPEPFVHHVQRRCRVCRDLITVTLLAGAEVVRDPYFTCSWCRVTPHTSLALVEDAAQLRLEDDVA